MLITLLWHHKECAGSLVSDAISAAGVAERTCRSEWKQSWLLFPSTAMCAFAGESYISEHNKLGGEKHVPGNKNDQAMSTVVTHNCTGAEFS